MKKKRSQDSTYRKTYWFSFKNRKLEENYQIDYQKQTKPFRRLFFLVFTIYLTHLLKQGFNFNTLCILAIILMRLIIEIKYFLRGPLLILINGLTLAICKGFLVIILKEKGFDPLYSQFLTLFLHYILLSLLPMNILVALGTSYFISPEEPFFNYFRVTQIVLICILNVKMRNSFILIDSIIKQQKTFNLMVENSPHSIFVIDMNHKIEFANAQARELMKKHLKNVSEKNCIGLNLMVFFEEKFHEKINKAIYECSLSHSTVKIFQIPLVCKQEPFLSLAEQTSSPLSLNNMSLSKTTLFKGEESKSQKFIKQNVFINLSIQNTFWKGGHFFLVTMEPQVELNKILEISDKCFSLINNLLLESVDLMEKDYQKWNNFQAIKVILIKESDLKDLATTVIECNRIKGLISAFKNIFQLSLDKTDHILIKFNIRYTIVQCMELISMRAIEKKMELFLKFEESFPEYVFGEYENFKQLFHCLLRIINISNLSPTQKNMKFTLFCNLNKYSDDGRFILTFIFEYVENTSNLYTFLSEICQDYVPNEPFNFSYLIAHADWTIDQLSLIPLMRLLEVSEVKIEQQEEKSQFSMEIAFHTSDHNLSSGLDKSNQSHHHSNSSPSTAFLNKKPLQLSFCRISSNVNNVIWKEKPQAVLDVTKQTSNQKKKMGGFHGDFMKTSIKPGLLLQLEKEKEKEKDREKIFKEKEMCSPLLLPHENLDIIPENLNCNMGANRICINEFENSNNNSNAFSNSNNNNNIKNSNNSNYNISSSNNNNSNSGNSANVSFKPITNSNSSNIGVKITKGTPSFEFIKKDSDENNFLINGSSPSWKQNDFPNKKADSKKEIKHPPKLEIVNNGTTEKKPKNSMLISRIYEKEMESSNYSSKKDVLDNEKSTKEREKIISELDLSHLEMNIFPKVVSDLFEKAKVDAIDNFERHLYSIFQEILEKYCPERIEIIDKKGMKRNYSDFQLLSLEKPQIASPKSSLLHTKRKKTPNNFFSVFSSKKKFSFRSNIMNSLVKRSQNSFFGAEKEKEKEYSEFFDESSCSPQIFLMSNNHMLSPSFSNIPIYLKEFEKMKWFICQRMTCKRSWVINENRIKSNRKDSLYSFNALIIAKNKASEGELNLATYLRTLLGKSIEEKMNVFFVEGFEQFSNYLQMKLHWESYYKYVFLECKENYEEVIDAVKQYKEFEITRKNELSSVIFCFGKEETCLKSLSNLVNGTFALNGDFESDSKKIKNLLK